MTSEIVDSGSTTTHFAFRVDTDGMAEGDVKAVTLHRNQLLQGAGVKTMPLLNLQSLSLHPMEYAEPTGAEFGITVGTSTDPLNPDAINTPTRSVYHANGQSTAFHAIHTTGAAFHNVTLPLHAEPLADPTLPAKAALRWRVDPTADTGVPFEIMGPEHVNYGVTKSVAGDDTKYLITRGDPDKPSAIDRLLDLGSGLCGGRYTKAARNEVNYNGQTAVVMSEADFDSVAGPLRESLAANAAANTDITFFIHKLNDAPAPSCATLPVTFNRTPRPLEGHDKATISLADLARCLPVVGEAQAAPTPVEALVHPDAAADVQVKYETLSETVPN